MDRLDRAAPRRAAGLATALTALLIGASLTAVSAGPVAAAADPAVGVRLTGGDISWPNCPKGMGIPSRRTQGMPLPYRSAQFVIVGLTNGPGFTPNPCFGSHVAFAKATGRLTGAYAMTTYPTKAQRATYSATGPWSAALASGRLRNAGYSQALVNVAAMRAADLVVPMVWVDVEPYAVAPWSRSHGANREVVRGVVRGYEDSGYRVGFYSYDGGWRAVVGAWRKPAYPAWVPVGHTRNGVAVASARCGRASFSGGEVLLAQWVEANRDRDVTCPRLVGRVAGPHPLTRWLDRRLHKGSRGTAVRALQRAIGVGADGVFGKQTLATLIRFQRSHGLVANGITGASTWRALGAGRQLSARPSRLAEVFTRY